MSGSSGNNGDHPVALKSAAEQKGYNSSDVDAWLATNGGASYASQGGETLKSATYAGGKFYGSNARGGGTALGAADITGMANAFLAWKATQTDLQNHFNQYAEAATAQPGRDATILTGVQRSPNSILGGG